MHKRTFLQKALFTVGGCCLTCRPLKNPTRTLPALPSFRNSTDNLTVQTVSPEPGTEVIAYTEQADIPHNERVRDFDRNYPEDILLSNGELSVFKSTLARFSHVERSLGHGKFNLARFDDVLYYANRISGIGAFTAAEREFIDKIFDVPATDYGFLGDKVITKLTHAIPEREVINIQGSGQYLYQGDPVKKFSQLRRDVGNDLMLASGIRNVSKQLHLFLSKIQETSGNVSRASRSIAPPGYSFHGTGDFDVGTIRLGDRNLTADFSGTPEYREMMRLGYVDIRYTSNNQLGVRFEPWHIKIG